MILVEVWIILVLWSLVGFGILFVLSSNHNFINCAENFEFVNPVYIYKQTKVNWFGCFWLALLLNALCPIGTIGYWSYKLYTVCRK